MVKTKRCLFTVSQIAEAVKGRRINQCSVDCNILRVSIDSRNCGCGTLFVPLKGTKTDGHYFIESAFRNGSPAVFVESEFFKIHKAELISCAGENSQLIVVDDTLKALQDLAGYYRSTISSVTFIGITGSSGKTTTKELIGSILSREASTMVSEGNKNSEVGLPLSIFDINNEHAFAVLEMGINKIGEMDILSNILRPDIGIITNIGTAHIGFIGSKKKIADEKKKIFSHFSGSGTGFINEDEQYFNFLSKGIRGDIISFGRKNTPGFTGSKIDGLSGSVITINNEEIHLPLIGSYNIQNALCAISVAGFLGIGNDKIKEGIESAIPLFGRGEIIKGRVTIVLDCYNANPESVVKAIDFLNSVYWRGRKIIIIGSMKELGSDTEKYHKEIGKKISAAGIDAAFLYGSEMKAAYNVAVKNEFEQIFWTEDYKRLEEELLNYIKEGDIVLIKGSRSMELERIAVPIRNKSFREDGC